MKKWDRSDKISISNLVASCILGCAALVLSIKGCYDSKQLAEQGQKIKDFNILIADNKEVNKNLNKELEILNRQLGKTDTVISLSDSQLIYSQIQQKIANRNYAISEIGGMNRLYWKAKRINEYYMFTLVLKFNISTFSENSKMIDTLLGMFYEEMNNPYLNEHIDIDNKWRSAYNSLANVYFFVNEEIRSPSDYHAGIVSSRISECLGRMGGAAHAAMDFIESDRIKMGIEVPLKDGDMVIIKAYPKVIYKVIKPDRNGRGFMCVRQSKANRPNVSDTIYTDQPWVQKVKY